MSSAARFFRWHRWAGYLVGLQVVAWIVGGLLFAWLPFQPWVKSADVVAKPQQDLPVGWTRALAGLAEQGASAPVRSVHSVATASGPALKVVDANGTRWLGMAGGELPSPDAAAVERFARSLYRGDAPLRSVQRVTEAPRRLGIVRELGDRADAWQATFGDRLNTRLYFDARSGEVLAVRNDAWVVYDFFFRLHVMDYAGGDDFNNALLRAATVAALVLMVTGTTLSVRSLLRHRRRLRRRFTTAA